MIIVNLKGGLGNQMFEYAAGRRLALKHHTELKLDKTFLLDHNPALNIVFRNYDLDIFPNINVGTATNEEAERLKYYMKPFLDNRFARKLLAKPGYFKEKQFSYNPTFEELGNNVYLDGYWQSEKYFKPIEEVIRRDFALPSFKIEKNVVLGRELRATQSVCINIRRGDFVENANSSKQHGFIGLDFIHTAVQRLIQSLKMPQFYIFSDDISWCMENIKLTFPTVLVDHSHAGNKFSEYLHLMSLCHHFIIPNSSFAWWAAWLCTNPGKIVVAPKKWFNEGPQNTEDLIPHEWIRL